MWLQRKKKYTNDYQLQSLIINADIGLHMIKFRRIFLSIIILLVIIGQNIYQNMIKWSPTTKVILNLQPFICNMFDFHIFLLNSRKTLLLMIHCSKYFSSCHFSKLISNIIFSLTRTFSKICYNYSSVKPVFSQDIRLVYLYRLKKELWSF